MIHNRTHSELLFTCNMHDLRYVILIIIMPLDSCQIIMVYIKINIYAHYVYLWWMEKSIAAARRQVVIPDSRVHGANTGPTRVLSAPGGPHLGPMNLAIRDIPAVYGITVPYSTHLPVILLSILKRLHFMVDHCVSYMLLARGSVASYD